MVIGKDAKDVPREKALEYVAAYTAGNDISSRKLQRDPAYAGKIPQWGFSKGFDTFAPLGPCLVAAAEIPDPAKLHLKTIVDGEVRQDESVSDLLFDCSHIISYLSQGTTLQKGSVIMTGTPGGKQSSRQPTQWSEWLTQGRCWRGNESAEISSTWYADGCRDLSDRHPSKPRYFCVIAAFEQYRISRKFGNEG